jgi:hypothetical protein
VHLLSREFLLLFFLPISLALVHSIIALLDLANLLTGTHQGDLLPKVGVAPIIMQAFVPVALLYLASFIAYFWIALVSYLRRMQLATG